VPVRTIAAEPAPLDVDTGRRRSYHDMQRDFLEPGGLRRARQRRLAAEGSRRPVRQVLGRRAGPASWSSTTARGTGPT